jgi:hypothetical protein
VEVADPPETYQDGKMVRVRVRKPGDTSVTDVEHWAGVPAGGDQAAATWP